MVHNWRPSRCVEEIVLEEEGTEHNTNTTVFFNIFIYVYTILLPVFGLYRPSGNLICIIYSEINCKMLSRDSNPIDSQRALESCSHAPDPAKPVIISSVMPKLQIRSFS